MIWFNKILQLLITVVQEMSNSSWNWVRFFEVLSGVLIGGLITFLVTRWKMIKELEAERAVEFKRWFRKEYIEGALDPIIEALHTVESLRIPGLDCLPEFEKIPLHEARKIEKLLGTKAISIYFILLKRITNEIKPAVNNEESKPREFIKLKPIYLDVEDIIKELENVRNLLFKSNIESLEDLDKILNLHGIPDIVNVLESSIQKSCNEFIEKLFQDIKYKDYLEENVYSRLILRKIQNNINELFGASKNKGVRS